MSLDTYLKGSEPAKSEAVEVAPPPEPATEPAKETRPRDESGRFAKGEEPKPEAAEAKSVTPAPKEEVKTELPEVSGLKAGIAAERKQRQELERRLAELMAQQQAKPEPRPDVIADPEGYATSIEQKMQAALVNQQVNISYAIAKRQHDDFDQVMAEWPAMMQADPSLYQKAIQQEMPAEWAYQQVKRSQFLREVGDDPSSYRQKLEAELRQKLEAEYAAKTPVVPSIPTPPPSLAGARSNGRMSDPIWNGPPSLSQILKR